MRVLSAFAAAALLMAGPAFAQSFTLTSKDMTEGGRLAKAQVANVFGCSGGNVSPELAWSGAPAGTKSFVVTAYDPDAPTGSGFWHWAVANLPAAATGMPAGAATGKGLPAGAIQVRNDAGASAFIGACPPAGPMHRYVFTVHALGVPALEVSAETPAALLGFMANANSLAKATLTAVYNN